MVGLSFVFMRDFGRSCVWWEQEVGGGLLAEASFWVGNAGNTQNVSILVEIRRNSRLVGAGGGGGPLGWAALLLRSLRSGGGSAPAPREGLRPLRTPATRTWEVRILVEIRGF